MLNLSRLGKCTPSSAKPNEQELSVLIPRLQENNRTALSVDLRPMSQNGQRHSSGTQTVDDEFQVPYSCPTHNVLKRQDGQLTPTIEVQEGNVGITLHLHEEVELKR